MSTPGEKKLASILVPEAPTVLHAPTVRHSSILVHHLNRTTSITCERARGLMQALVKPGAEQASKQASRVFGELDSEKYSLVAAVTAPSLETGDPPTPCGLHTASSPVASGVTSLKLVGGEGCDVGQDIFG